MDEELLKRWYGIVEKFLWDYGIIDEDMQQNIIMKVMQGVKKFNPDKGMKLNSWLTTVALNAIKLELKYGIYRGQKAFENNTEQLTHDGYFNPSSYNLERDAIGKIATAEIYKMLSPRQKDIFRLYWLGHRANTIARMLNLPVNYVTKVHIAIRKKAINEGWVGCAS